MGNHGSQPTSVSYHSWEGVPFRILDNLRTLYPNLIRDEEIEVIRSSPWPLNHEEYFCYTVFLIIRIYNIKFRRALLTPLDPSTNPQHHAEFIILQDWLKYIVREYLPCEIKKAKGEKETVCGSCEKAKLQKIHILYVIYQQESPYQYLWQTTTEYNRLPTAQGLCDYIRFYRGSRYTQEELDRVPLLYCEGIFV